MFIEEIAMMVEWVAVSVFFIENSIDSSELNDPVLKLSKIEHILL